MDFGLSRSMRRRISANRSGDAGALGRALARLLSDRGRCREMGDAAAARIRGWNFDADVDGLRQALPAVCQGPVDQGPRQA